MMNQITTRPTHLMAVALVIFNCYCLDYSLKELYPNDNITQDNQIVIVDLPVEQLTYNFDYTLDESQTLVEELHGDNPKITLNDPKPTEEKIKDKILEPTKHKKKLVKKDVTVTFYDPFDRKQTDDTPGICYWDYHVKPGDKIIAISHDLIKKYGLTDGDIVTIDEWGKYVVRDAMNKRWRSKIDIAITNPRLSKREKYKLAMNLGHIEKTIRFMGTVSI